MIEIRPAHPEHLLLIDIVDGQAHERVNVAATGGEIALAGVARSVWVNHRCVWAGGVIPKWQDVGFGWALFSKGSYPFMDAITAVAKAMIETPTYKRVEITVDPDYKAGHRWARALGLTLEAERLRCYGPGGRDMALYSYVRGSDNVVR